MWQRLSAGNAASQAEMCSQCKTQPEFQRNHMKKRDKTVILCKMKSSGDGLHNNVNIPNTWKWLRW